MLDTIHAPSTWVRTTVGRLEPMWWTVMWVRSVKGALRTSPILYKRGLFQGDVLSPLLFCLAILPLSHALKRMNGYRIRRSTVKGSITHTLYMDDLKLSCRKSCCSNSSPVCRGQGCKRSWHENRLEEVRSGTYAEGEGATWASKP